MIEQTPDPTVWDPSHNPDILHPVLQGSVLGHESVLEDVRQAWLANRLPHALMLCGPKGIGKATTAYCIARFLLHHGAASGETDMFGAPVSPETWHVADDSPAVRRLCAGSHADFIPVVRSLDPKTKKLRREIGVDDSRAILNFAHHTAGEGAWRVVIIDAADEMNRNAANAVLKVLEEPPKNTLLILVAHRPGRLLPTIRSRCQKWDLRPLTLDQMRQVMANHGGDIDQTFLPLIMALSEGSPGRAMRYMSNSAVDVVSTFFAHIQKMPDMDIPELHKFADMLHKPTSEAEYVLFQDVFRWWLHRISRVQVGGFDDMEVYPGEHTMITALNNRVPLDRWLTVWDKVNHLFERAERINLERRQVVLSAMMDLAHAVRI